MQTANPEWYRAFVVVVVTLILGWWGSGVAAVLADRMRRWRKSHGYRR